MDILYQPGREEKKVCRSGITRAVAENCFVNTAFAVFYVNTESANRLSGTCQASITPIRNTTNLNTPNWIVTLQFV